MENFESFEVKINSTLSSSEGWTSIWGSEALRHPFESTRATLLLLVRNLQEGEEIKLRVIAGVLDNPGDPTELGRLAPSECLTIQLNGLRAIQAKCIDKGRDSKVVCRLFAVA